MKKKGEKAIIVLYDDLKRVLMQDRFGITHDKEQEWGFFGGTIEPGETPEAALAR